VTTRFTWRRIHDRGEFLGLAPTGMEMVALRGTVDEG
jgi:hypothetical protein